MLGSKFQWVCVKMGTKVGSPEIARAIKELSRLKYGRDRDEVEMEFRRRQEASNFA